MPRPPPSELRPQEWFLVLAGCLTLLAFALVGLLYNDPVIPEEPLAETVVATIEGAVAFPGSYELPFGSSVGDLLERASPDPDADLRRIRRSALLKQGKFLRVRKLPKITVYLKGAVTLEGPLELPKGTRLEELIELAPLTGNADKSFLKRRRKLKEGEIISVPEQK